MKIRNKYLNIVIIFIFMELFVKITVEGWYSILEPGSVCSIRVLEPGFICTLRIRIIGLHTIKAMSDRHLYY